MIITIIGANCFLCLRPIKLLSQLDRPFAPLTRPPIIIITTTIITIITIIISIIIITIISSSSSILTIIINKAKCQLHSETIVVLQPIGKSSWRIRQTAPTQLWFDFICFYSQRQTAWAQKCKILAFPNWGQSAIAIFYNCTVLFFFFAFVEPWDPNP